MRLSWFLTVFCKVLGGFGSAPESPWAPQLHRIPTNSHQNFTRFHRILVRISSDFHRGAELGSAFDPRFDKILIRISSDFHRGAQLGSAFEPRFDKLLIRIPSGFHRGAPLGSPFAAESVFDSVLQGFGRVWECRGVAVGTPTPSDFHQLSSGLYKIPSDSHQNIIRLLSRSTLGECR